MEDLIQSKLKLLKKKPIKIARVIYLIDRYRDLNKDLFSSEVVLRDKDKYSNTDKRKIVTKCWELLKCEEEVLFIVKDVAWVQEVFTILNNGNKRRGFELTSIIRKLKYNKPS